MLSRRCEYALRALVDLGLAREAGRPLVRVAAIAERERIPVKFLEQILLALRKAGYLRSPRGRRGGYTLAKAATPGPGAAEVVRVGHFPNETHAHGLVAQALSRAGKGWFEERLGPGVKIEWYLYNAGPSAMEAVLAGALDLAYVGPNPALNAHIRSKGEEVRVLAGATRGGSALVVRGDGKIAKP